MHSVYRKCKKGSIRAASFRTSSSLAAVTETDVLEEPTRDLPPLTNAVLLPGF